MLGPKQLRTAIILCKRAPLTGEEAHDADQAIQGLEALFNTLIAPREDRDGGHTRTD